MDALTLLKEDHERVEEGKLFPNVRELFSEAELRELGDEMMELKQDALQEAETST